MPNKPHSRDVEHQELMKTTPKSILELMSCHATFCQRIRPKIKQTPKRKESWVFVGFSLRANVPLLFSSIKISWLMWCPLKCCCISLVRFCLIRRNTAAHTLSVVLIVMLCCLSCSILCTVFPVCYATENIKKTANWYSVKLTMPLICEETFNLTWRPLTTVDSSWNLNFTAIRLWHTYRRISSLPWT